MFAISLNHPSGDEATLESFLHDSMLPHDANRHCAPEAMSPEMISEHEDYCFWASVHEAIIIESFSSTSLKRREQLIREREKVNEALEVAQAWFRQAVFDGLGWRPEEPYEVLSGWRIARVKSEALTFVQPRVTYVGPPKLRLVK